MWKTADLLKRLGSKLETWSLMSMGKQSMDWSTLRWWNCCWRWEDCPHNNILYCSKGYNLVGLKLTYHPLNSHLLPPAPMDLLKCKLQNYSGLLVPDTVTIIFLNYSFIFWGIGSTELILKILHTGANRNKCTHKCWVSAGANRCEIKNCSELHAAEMWPTSYLINLNAEWILRYKNC